MNRKYERPEIKQVTKQWVRENCTNVTERDMGLLELLADRRILRRDQIQQLYPHFSSSDFLNKRLNILFKKHLIDKIYPTVGLGKGSAKQHICLDRAGMILLDKEGYTKPIRTDKDGNRSLPLGWEHTIMLNEYECQIRDFFNEPHSEIKYYYSETGVHFGDTRLIPDIFFLVKHKGKGYAFFVEVDLGTEDIPYVKKKFDTYVNYYASKRWVGDEWARLFKTPVFPRVLFFTENGRSKRVNTLREYSKDLSVRFFVEEHNNLFKTLYSITEG